MILGAMRCLKAALTEGVRLVELTRVVSPVWLEVRSLPLGSTNSQEEVREYGKEIESFQ